MFEYVFTVSVLRIAVCPPCELRHGCWEESSRTPPPPLFVNTISVIGEEVVGAESSGCAHIQCPAHSVHFLHSILCTPWKGALYTTFLQEVIGKNADVLASGPKLDHPLWIVVVAMVCKFTVPNSFGDSDFGRRRRPPRKETPEASQKRKPNKYN